MIANGPRVCYQCGTTFEFDGGLPVEVRWSAAPCVGCERWNLILERARALALAAAAKKAEQPEAMDLSPAANLERLMAGKREPEVRDWAVAAAGGERE